MNVDLSGIPPGWFLELLQDRRTSVTYRGDTHVHLIWKVQLQHERGGRLQEARGETPQEALDRAIKNVEHFFPNGP